METLNPEPHQTYRFPFALHIGCQNWGSFDPSYVCSFRPSKQGKCAVASQLTSVPDPFGRWSKPSERQMKKCNPRHDDG